jgi:hypothetical protein
LLTILPSSLIVACSTRPIGATTTPRIWKATEGRRGEVANHRLGGLGNHGHTRSIVLDSSNGKRRQTSWALTLVGCQQRASCALLQSQPNSFELHSRLPIWKDFRTHFPAAKVNRLDEIIRHIGRLLSMIAGLLRRHVKIGKISRKTDRLSIKTDGRRTARLTGF